MEFEGLSEGMQREAQRVAAAFKVREWSDGGSAWLSGYDTESTPIRVMFNRASDGVDMVAVSNGADEASCWFDSHDDELSTDPGLVDSDTHRSSAILAYGLYRLGIDNEAVWRELNVTLSAHEKLELRLSMPREFCPKTWVDEENEGESS